jgi:hypothetical protein
MRILPTLSVLSIAIFIIACDESKESTEPSVNHEHVVSENVEVNAHDEIADELHLHGTEKWKVSEHMMAHIQKVDSLILNYSDAEMNGVTLATQIDEQLVMVTQTCDMKGESHAQLHLWLLPFWNLVDQLKESSSAEQEEQLLSDMTKSMLEYHTYFE